MNDLVVKNSNYIATATTMRIRAVAENTARIA
jgi:hypothetical protein